MRVSKTIGALVLLSFIGTAVGADPPTTRPDAMLLSQTNMPAIDIANQPLDKVLEQIKAKVPGFNYVVNRGQYDKANFPVLNAMSFQNVSIEQFLELIADEYGVAYKEINDPLGTNPPLVEINIHNMPTTEPATAQPTVVRVFGLSQIIDYRASFLKGDGDHAKQATNDILSLIQAALDESDSSVKPTLKIHAPTQTLICKVTKDQGDVIEQVLQSLKPTEAQMKQFEEDQRSSALATQQLQVLQEVDKINGEAAATRTAPPATRPAK